MSARSIRIIVVLMALAVAALIGVQAIWINSIVKISKDELRKASLEAMSAIVEKLQRAENLDMIHKKIRFDKTKGDTAEIKMVISSHEIFYDKATKERKDSSFTVIRKGNVDEKALQVKIDTDRKSFTMRPGHEKKVIIYTGNGPGKKEKDLDLLIKQMVLEMGSNDLRAAERINKDSLPLIIRSELMRKGLDVPFSYAVFSPAAAEKYSLRSQNFSESMKDNSLRAELFPADLLLKKDFLLVHLENERAYLFSKMKGMLFLTLFITLLILTVFYVTIRTILRQKKLADIKNDFINNMSHEFKTPIATINIAVDAIVNPKVRENREKLDYYSSIIKEENNKMNDHVERVLTLALAGKQQLNLNHGHVDMHRLIGNCLGSFELLTREKQVQVHTELSATISVVKGDDFHLYGVVKNIIDNAVKYISTMPVIMIRTYNEGDLFCFSVRDNGPGMSRETLKNIFDKFYRAQTGNVHDVKGFGLGLNYVKNIVETHKGEVMVESEQGRGSVFTVKLKLA